MGVIMEKSAGDSSGDRAALRVRSSPQLNPPIPALNLSKFSLALQLNKKHP